MDYLRAYMWEAFVIVINPKSKYQTLHFMSWLWSFIAQIVKDYSLPSYPWFAWYINAYDGKSQWSHTVKYLECQSLKCANDVPLLNSSRRQWSCNKVLSILQITGKGLSLLILLVLHIWSIPEEDNMYHCKEGNVQSVLHVSGIRERCSWGK